MSISAVLAGDRRWHVVEGDCLSVMADVSAVDHVITDPPYSEHVHRNVKSTKRVQSSVTGASCQSLYTVDLGFEHITQDTIEAVADHVDRLCQRWFLVFSDIESAHLWRDATVDVRYASTAFWVRGGGAPHAPC